MPDEPEVPDEPLEPDVPDEPDEPEVPLEPSVPEVPSNPLKTYEIEKSVLSVRVKPDTTDVAVNAKYVVKSKAFSTTKIT